jgi:hypothetical protein
MENAELREFKVSAEAKFAQLEVFHSAISCACLIHLQSKDVAQDARLASLEDNVAAQQVWRPSYWRHISTWNRHVIRSSSSWCVASTPHVFVALKRGITLMCPQEANFGSLQTTIAALQVWVMPCRFFGTS